MQTHKCRPNSSGHAADKQHWDSLVIECALCATKHKEAYEMLVTMFCEWKFSRLRALHIAIKL